jgi:hypothetical protein
VTNGKEGEGRLISGKVYLHCKWKGHARKGASISRVLYEEEDNTCNDGGLKTSKHVS